MANDFTPRAAGQESPADAAFDIIPQVDLATITRAVYVGVKGDLAVEMKNGAVVTFKNVPSGTVLPIRIRKVLMTSTASSILGLY